MEQLKAREATTGTTPVRTKTSRADPSQQTQTNPASTTSKAVVPSDTRIRVFVEVCKPVYHKPFSLEVELCAKIQDVKEMIYKQEGVPVHIQSLCLLGRPLDDGTTLNDYPIREGCTLELTIRLRSESWIKVKCHGPDIDMQCLIGAQYTVEDLKLLIERKEGIPVDQQRLFCAGKVLEGKALLADCAVHTGSTVLLVPRR